MERTIYIVSLIVTALINFGMAAKLLYGTQKYAAFPVYRRTRILTILWLVIFAVGYIFWSWLVLWFLYRKKVFLKV